MCKNALRYGFIGAMAACCVVVFSVTAQAQSQVPGREVPRDTLPAGAELGVIDLGPDKTKAKEKTHKKEVKKAERQEAKATRKLQRVTPVPNPEKMPQPGYDVDAFIAANLKYPAAARQARVTGQVYVQYIVNEDGHISEAKVMKGLGSGCDEEAVRVVSRLPAYKTPARQGTAPVPVRVVKPVKFKP
jgi:protein TonB